MKRGGDGIACAFGYRDCRVQHVAGVKIPKKLSDKEANRVVLPIIPRNWVLAKDWKPEDEEIETWPGFGVAARYLESIGAPECCTEEEPCDKHRGALRGRDWKTGEYL